MLVTLLVTPLVTLLTVDSVGDENNFIEKLEKSAVKKLNRISHLFYDSNDLGSRFDFLSAEKLDCSGSLASIYDKVRLGNSRIKKIFEFP